MPTPTSQNKLILALIIVVGFAAGYLYYSQSIAPTEQPVPPPAVSDKDNLKTFDNMKINFDILKDDKYKSLQKFGESPVSPGVTGKKDLFAPI